MLDNAAVLTTVVFIDDAYALGYSKMRNWGMRNYGVYSCTLFCIICVCHVHSVSL